LRTPYYEGTHLEFAGESANHLYSFIKNNKFNWNQLEQYGTFLRRIDTCYDRPQKSTDKVTNDTFLEATLKHLKRVFPNNNLEYRRNRSGELINVGHRTSAKYYRVYLKGECLRFEFEHKYRKTLNLYDHFLKTKQFRKLEQRISYEFLKQTQHLFSYSQETEKVEWLAQRLRPFQTRNNLADSGTTINIHYMQQCSMEKLQKQDLIRLFQLLAYLKLLDGYKTAKSQEICLSANQRLEDDSLIPQNSESVKSKELEVYQEPYLLSVDDAIAILEARYGSNFIAVENGEFKIQEWQATKKLEHAVCFGIKPEDYGFSQEQAKEIGGLGRNSLS
jgi:hypothetical protein